MIYLYLKQRGNPMGGLLYTTAWGGGYKQVIEWHK